MNKNNDVSNKLSEILSKNKVICSFFLLANRRFHKNRYFEEQIVYCPFPFSHVFKKVGHRPTNIVKTFVNPFEDQTMNNSLKIRLFIKTKILVNGPPTLKTPNNCMIIVPDRL